MKLLRSGFGVIEIVLVLVLVCVMAFGVYKFQAGAQTRYDAGQVTAWIDKAVESTCDVLPQYGVLTVAEAAEKSAAIDAYISARSKGWGLPGKLSFVHLPEKEGNSVFTLRFSSDDDGFGREFERQLSPRIVGTTLEVIQHQETCGSARLRAESRKSSDPTPKKHAPLIFPR